MRRCAIAGCGTRLRAWPASPRGASSEAPSGAVIRPMPACRPSLVGDQAAAAAERHEQGAAIVAAEAQAGGERIAGRDVFDQLAVRGERGDAAVDDGGGEDIG